MLLKLLRLIGSLAFAHLHIYSFAHLQGVIALTIHNNQFFNNTANPQSIN
jgi:hypothetical protein